MKILPRLRISRGARRGTTIVEVAISSALTVVIVGASIGVYGSGREAFARGAIESSIRAEATQFLDAVATELAECGAATASIAAADEKGGPYLTVQRCIGVDGTKILWGAPVTIGCDSAGKHTQAAPVAGAPMDDVSPWTLVMSTGGNVRTLGVNLAPKGLQITLAGSVVTLRLEMLRPVPGKAPVRVTALRKIRLAN